MCNVKNTEKLVVISVSQLTDIRANMDLKDYGLNTS